MMTYKGYTATYELDENDNVFYGKLTGINQLVTFEAETAKDLVTAFHDSVDDYLAFCHEQGIEPDKPYKGAFNVRAGEELHRKAVIASKGSSLNSFVVEAMREKLERLAMA